MKGFQNIDGLENELNYQSDHKMATNTNVSAQCMIHFLKFKFTAHLLRGEMTYLFYPWRHAVLDPGHHSPHRHRGPMVVYHFPRARSRLPLSHLGNFDFPASSQSQQKKRVSSGNPHHFYQTAKNERLMQSEIHNIFMGNKSAIFLDNDYLYMTNFILVQKHKIWLFHFVKI